MVSHPSLRFVPSLILLAFAASCDRPESPVGPPPHLSGFVAQTAGDKIAFTSNRDGNNEIYVMNVDGTGVTRLTDNPADDQAPAWSPDGNRIAFASTRDGNREIYVMNADGTDVTRLTNDPHTDTDPAWCGSRIAFMSDRFISPFPDVYVMNDDGSGVTRLTIANADFDRQPAWSPTCDRIAFTKDPSGNVEIYVMNADGTGATRLTNSPGYDEGPAWSPDGTKLAFSSTRDGDPNREIYVMNADGTGATRLTSTSSAIFDTDPSWSPDGSQIAFRSNRDGNNEIYIMNADGSGVTRLTNDAASDGLPAWAAGVGSSQSSGVLFESNWTTALGATDAALRDVNAPFGPWDFWNDGTAGTLQGGAPIMEVVSGGPPGYSNSLRVQQRGECGECWADVRKNEFIATPNTDYFVRFYFKTDDVNATVQDHGVEPWNGHATDDLTYLNKTEGPSGWGFRLKIGVNATDGHGGFWPTFDWNLVDCGGECTADNQNYQPLAYGTWYRLEYWVHFTSSNHIQIHPRVYDAAGTLLYDELNFVQEGFLWDGGAVCGGENDWTLDRWYGRVVTGCNPGGDFQIDPTPGPDQTGTTLQGFLMGNNGQAGALNTGLFWYYAGLQIRDDTWPGP